MLIIEVPFTEVSTLRTLRAAYRFMEKLFYNKDDRTHEDTDRFIAYGMVVSVLATLQEHVNEMPPVMNSFDALRYAIECLKGIDTTNRPLQRAIYDSAIQDIHTIASRQFCIYSGLPGM